MTKNLKKSNFILALLSLVFIKCNISSHKTELSGTWYAEASNDYFYEEGDNEECLSIFPDYTFTLLKGYESYTYGQWEIDNNDGDKIIFKNAYGKKPEPMLLKSTKEKKLLIAKRTSGKYKFEKASVPLKNLEDEPYHNSNLQWKIKSRQIEPFDTIKFKLINYIEHNAKIMNATLERKEDIINFTFSKGPLKMYQSAVGLVPYEKVNKEWIATFYNDSTAKLAYSYLEKSILYGNYKKYTSDEWIKDNYKILQDILSDIEKMKE